MKKPRMVVVLDERDVAPLFLTRFASEGLSPNKQPNFAHLLRAIDLPKVANVISTLNARNMDVYLAGSVVTYPLFKGWIHQYADIDLVAVGEKKEVSGLVRELLSTEKGTSPSPFDYSKRVDLEGESVGYSVKFGVKQGRKDQSLYVPAASKSVISPRSLSYTDRFSLSLVQPSYSNVRPIDLLLYDRGQFKKTRFVGE